MQEEFALIFFLHLAGSGFKFVATGEALAWTLDGRQDTVSAESANGISDSNIILRWVNRLNAWLAITAFQECVYILTPFPVSDVIATRSDCNDERIKLIDRDDVCDTGMNGQLSIGLLTE